MNKYLQATIKAFGTPKWAALRATRRAFYKRKCPGGQIPGTHFTIFEFYCRDGMPPPTRAWPHLLWYVKTICEPMRNKFGPCTVSGPYRHYWYNKNVVHGASLSFHVWDRYVDNTVKGSALACDLSFAKGTVENWADYAEVLLRRAGRGGGIGRYFRSRFVHVDTRLMRSRWTGN